MATSHTPCLSFQLKQLQTILETAKAVQGGIGSKLLVCTLSYKVQLLIQQLDK